MTNVLEENFKDIPNPPSIGDDIEGKVITLNKSRLFIDLSPYGTGVIYGREFIIARDIIRKVNPGDLITAKICGFDTKEGYIELSLKEARQALIWKDAEQAVLDKTHFDLAIQDANKGGLMITWQGIQGFLPASQLKSENYPKVEDGNKDKIQDELKKLIGKKISVSIITADAKENKLIFSEKEVWEEEQKNILDSYKVGDKIEGEVSALTPFGAFVKFGEGLEGLVHISEIVWQRIDHPKDILKVGDKVKAQIIDLNKSKIYLSLKRLVDDPWKAVKEKYKIGQIVKGEVHKVESFGLMVKLDDQIHGLAHISDLSDKRVTDPKELLTKFEIGKPYNFEIISIEPAEHRLGLRLEGVKKKEAKKEDEKTEEKKEEVSSEEKTA